MNNTFIKKFTIRNYFNNLFKKKIKINQFKTHILLHTPQPNSNNIHTHIKYIKFHYIKQTFRLKRYPVHFHLNNNIIKSYIKNYNFHQSFNRAINIHKTHNIIIKYNITYNIINKTIFLKNKIKTKNTFQYNLILFIITNSNLQNNNNNPTTF